MVGSFDQHICIPWVGQCLAIYLAAGAERQLWYFNGVIFVSNAAFNNLGRPFTSTLVNWGRHTLGTIPPVVLFSAWLGAPGVLIGQAVGGVFFAALSVILVLRLLGRSEATHAPDPFQRQSRLVQLFQHRR